MIIRINGKDEQVLEGQVLLDLLSEKRLDPQTLVIEHNGELLKRECFSALRLQPRDQVEILRFVGGG